MPPQKVQAIKERFEGVAADVLEDMIVDLEAHQPLKVKSIEVDVVQGREGDLPVVDVQLTVEPKRPGH